MADMNDTLDSGEALTELRGAVPTGQDIADPDVDVAFVAPDDRYELRSLLGEGGMGEVNLCRDRVIGREVAYKAVLASHARDAGIRSRFVREARVQGQLEHPAIVPVYDFGADRDGKLFFTMKRVRGETLELVIEGLRSGDQATARRYKLHKLLGAFVQVCLAIDYAHERGVLHRDLKPSNVMLGGYGEVYVLDWGLAKVRSASRTTESTRMLAASPVDTEPVKGEATPAATAIGAMLGTPAYMAPEQIRGDEVDGRADIYALGGILFELLTLEPLHGGGAVAAMMKRALDGVDARPSTRAPERDVAPELEALCVRACARDAKDRPSSARELADAIEAYLAGDRDAELREALAKQHLERARASTERIDALREVGRAVALAPTNPAALGLLTTLMTEPPREPPEEVLAAVEAARLEAQRRMLPRAALGYGLAWLVFLPVPALLGILDARWIVLPLAAWTIAALGAIVAHRAFAALHDSMWFLILASSVALAVSSVVFGPFLILPTMVLLNTMASLLVTRRDRRVFLIACNTLALLVPTALAWVGLHPVSHVVDGDRTLRIGLAAFSVSRGSMFAVLSAVDVVLIGLGVMFATRYRDALTSAEMQKQLQAWQLRHLVPAEATRALAASGGRGVPR